LHFTLGGDYNSSGAHTGAGGRWTMRKLLAALALTALLAGGCGICAAIDDCDCDCDDCCCECCCDCCD
jgi:hypothetical protein